MSQATLTNDLPCALRIALLRVQMVIKRAARLGRLAAEAARAVRLLIAAGLSAERAAAHIATLNLAFGGLAAQ